MSTFADPPSLPIAEANAAGFFRAGLEYDAPARGKWNIVHMGMLVPEAHQIYFCSQGCLRGVILTAAEMNALDRMSWVTVCEEDIVDGSLEQDIYDGTVDILTHLPKMPRAVLLAVSCMHLFAGVDYGHMVELLRDRFPDVDFIDCYMAPTMRKKIAPVVWFNEQMYALLRMLPENPRAVAVIGCDRPTDADSELVEILTQNGFALHEMPQCACYDDFLKIAESTLFLSYIPTGRSAAEKTAARFGRRHLHLPVSFDFDEIAANYRTLCHVLGIAMPDLSAVRKNAEDALRSAAEALGDMPVAIDFTAVTQPFSLAKLLCTHGICVTAVIADAVGEDAAAFRWLQENCPTIMLYSAVHPNMLHMAEATYARVLAVGQKAAYYFATDYFVNIVAGGGYYGFSGIAKLAADMADAAQHPKDRRPLLAHKGYGCESCLAGSGVRAI